MDYIAFLKRVFLSRRFVLSVVFAILVVLNKKLNLNLDNNALITLALVFGSFILGESYKDAKNAEAQHLVIMANEVEGKDIPEALATVAKEAFFRDAEKEADSKGADEAASKSK